MTWVQFVFGFWIGFNLGVLAVCLLAPLPTSTLADLDEDFIEKKNPTTGV